MVNMQGWAQKKEEKKNWSKYIRQLLLRKFNIFHPENEMKGPLKALKKRKQNSGKNLMSPIPKYCRLKGWTRLGTVTPPPPPQAPGCVVGLMFFW